MSLARRIIKGFFRLSLVALVAGAAWGLFDGLTYYNEMYRDYLDIRKIYECVARKSDDELLAHTTDGRVDASAFGCGVGRLKVDAVRDLRSTGSNENLVAAWAVQPPRWDFLKSTLNAVSWFLLVNLLGFVAAGLVIVSRWVAGGFTSR
jgi:hypothetical protein